MSPIDHTRFDTSSSLGGACGHCSTRVLSESRVFCEFVLSLDFNQVRGPTLLALDLFVSCESFCSCRNFLWDQIGVRNRGLPLLGLPKISGSNGVVARAHVSQYPVLIEHR